MTEYYICADGGGTKTVFVLFDQNGNILYSYKSLGTNARFIPINEAIDITVKGIEACCSYINVNLYEIKRVDLFVPGFSECIDQLKCKLQYDRVYLHSDLDNAFYGALGSSYGIVALAGTGSFAYGMSSNNKSAAAGGWGPVFGDYGSGYHIGVLCLRHITYQYDLGMSNDILAKLVLEHTKCTHVGELRFALNNHNIGRRDIADLCYVVEKAAIIGDQASIEILNIAAKEMAILVGIVSSRLGDPITNFTITGGVSKIGDIFVNKFKDFVYQSKSNLKYIEPVNDPIYGAVYFVLDKVPDSCISQIIEKGASEKNDNE